MTQRLLPPVCIFRRAILLAAFLLALSLPRPASAATITVNTFAQGSVAGCSFAEAIIRINLGSDGDGCVAVVLPDLYGTNDTIILPFGTYNFTVADNGVNGLPIILTSLTINGNGATLARTGAPAFRFFEVTTGSLTLNSLTLTGGNPGAGIDGGAVLDSSAGTLTITSSTFSGNTAQEGGAIFKRNGTGNLTVTGSTFTNNTATGSSVGDAEGGAIKIEENSGNVTVTGSTFTNNRATSSSGTGGDGDASGGAIVAENTGNVTVTGSTFTNNRATGFGGGDADGGAIEADENSNVTVTDSTFVNNRATSGGGASKGGALAVSPPDPDEDEPLVALKTVNNNCFVGNTAQSGGGVFGGGGGSPTLNAESNWWGAANGPSEAGPGSGDGVSTNVDFDPFLTSAPFAGCDIRQIPTLAEWAQLGMVALLIVGGLLALRRRARPA